MSARDDLIALIEDKCRAIGHEPDMHVDAYRAEVLREVRREILAASLATPDLKARDVWKAGYKAGLSMAAVICTPDTPKPAPPSP